MSFTATHNHGNPPSCGCREYCDGPYLYVRLIFSARGCQSRHQPVLRARESILPGIPLAPLGPMARRREPRGRERRGGTGRARERQPSGKRRGQQDPSHRPRRPDRYHKAPRPKGSPRRPLELKGTGGEVGLDGKLRVNLGPADVKTVGELIHRGGAEVVTNRNEPVGRVEAVVGTVQRPIAIVRLHPEARAMADRLSGKELFIG